MSDIYIFFMFLWLKPNSAGGFGGGGGFWKLQGFSALKWQKFEWNCALDNLRVIVLRLKINLASVLIQDLAWFGVLSCYVLWLNYSNNIFEWYD